MKAKPGNPRPGAQRLADWAALIGARGALLALGIYRFAFSPLLVVLFGHACRFTPTCAQYAHQALTSHGLWRGTGLALRRLLRCRPGGGWGYDPVSLAASSPRRSER